MKPTTTNTEKVYPRVHTNRHDLFTFVEVAPKNVVICVGQHQASEKQFNSLKAAKMYVEEKSWELICNVSSLVAQHTYNELKKKEHEKTK